VPIPSDGESRTIGAPDLTATDRAALLLLARGAVEAWATGCPEPLVPAVPAAGLRRGAFVTLEADGALRGCIGRLTGDCLLGDVVRTMAVAAARDDPRFPPVAAAELPVLRYEISVLSEAALLDPVEPGRIVIGRDGLWVRRGQTSGVLLPQVASEQGWTPPQFLAATCRKAGLPPTSWREPGTQVYTFQADIFGE